VDEHQSGLRDHSAPLWTLLMFQATVRDDHFVVAG
jgi:asparagine synthase (glutamine-hydrolysing)